VIYELGRYDAGYDRLAVAQQRAELEAAIEHLKQDNHELNLRLAEIDTQRIGWAREQAEVSRTIGDLQAQVARQAQDLAFYRGVGAQTRAHRSASAFSSCASARRPSPHAFACI
jgi:chromosome segregation ATPase